MANVKLCEILPKINIDTFQMMAHKCLDELCGRRATHYEDFKDLINCNANDFAVIISEIKTILCQITRAYKNKYQENGSSWAEVDHTYLKCLTNCLEARPNDVQALKTSIATSVMGPTLKDFDWNLKLVLGSSSLASLQQPLVTLDLDICEGDSPENRYSIEMDLSEVSKVISTLEQARDSLQSQI